MTQQAIGTENALVMCTDDGAWYKIPAADLEGYRMSEDEVARIQQQAPPVPEVQGFGQTTGTGTDTGFMYTWKGYYYMLIGVDPSFANL